MEIKVYTQMLRRGWWIVVLTALVAVNIALLASFFSTPLYQVSTRFVVSPSADLLTGKDVITSLEALDKRSIITTYAEFINSRRVYLEALRVLKLEETSMIDYVIQTVVLPNTNILELTVSGPDPQIATLLANTMGQSAINYISLIYGAYDISILDSAIPPKQPYSPQPVSDASLALILGLVSGGALAILSEQIRIPLESYRQRFRVDSQTGVFNNRYFSSILENELAEKPDVVLTVGIVELFGLKDIVGNLPLLASNHIMRMVSDVLRRELRGNDSIGRWTDTSFIVMLPATPGSASGSIFERIYSVLSQPVLMEQFSITINLDPKIGGAVYSNDISSQELLKQATSALEQTRRDNTRSIFIWEIKNPFWVQKEG